jgi:hypothetical protein
MSAAGVRTENAGEGGEQITRPGEPSSPAAGVKQFLRVVLRQIRIYSDSQLNSSVLTRGFKRFGVEQKLCDSVFLVLAFDRITQPILLF